MLELIRFVHHKRVVAWEGQWRGDWTVVTVWYKMDSDDDQVTFNFWGNNANTERTNPNFLFATDS